MAWTLPTHRRRGTYGEDSLLPIDFPRLSWYVSSMTNDRPLTKKQQAFAEALPTARSAKHAAELAGYPPGHQAESRASENVRKREIMQVVEQQLATAAEQAGISPVTVLKGLTADHDAAFEAKQYSAAIRALELMGKHLRLWGEEAPAPDQIAKALIEEISALARRSRGEALEGEGQGLSAQARVAKLVALPPGNGETPPPSP